VPDCRRTARPVKAMRAVRRGKGCVRRVKERNGRRSEKPPGHSRTRQEPRSRTNGGELLEEFLASQFKMMEANQGI
jgi:hypothetical protein